MPDFKIVSADDPRWSVRLESVDKAHAKSVLDQLEHDPTVPNNLSLIKRTLFRRF